MERKTAIAKIHKSGYDSAVIANDKELFVYSLSPAGTTATSMPVGTGSIQEVYEALKEKISSKYAMPHIVNDVCKFDSIDNILFLKGDEVDIADLMNVIEALQRKRTKC